MPITLKKDTWNVKDPISGNYRGAAILSTTLPEDAAQIIEDTQNALDAEEVRAGQIINDAQNAVDGIEGQSSLIQQKVANAVLNGNNYELIDTAVESWLDAHPEATTTVQDGSISKAKLTNNLQDIIEKADNHLWVNINPNMTYAEMQEIFNNNNYIHFLPGDYKLDFTEVESNPIGGVLNHAVMFTVNNINYIAYTHEYYCFNCHSNMVIWNEGTFEYKENSYLVTTMFRIAYDVSNVSIYGGNYIGNRYTFTGTISPNEYAYLVDRTNNITYNKTNPLTISGVTTEYDKIIGIISDYNHKASHINIHNMKMNNVYGDGIGCNGFYIEISNCEIKNTWRQGISIGSGEHVKIYDCYFYNDDNNIITPHWGIDIEFENYSLLANRFIYIFNDIEIYNIRVKNKNPITININNAINSDIPEAERLADHNIYIHDCYLPGGLNLEANKDFETKKYLKLSVIYKNIYVAETYNSNDYISLNVFRSNISEVIDAKIELLNIKKYIYGGLRIHSGVGSVAIHISNSNTYINTIPPIYGNVDIYLQTDSKWLYGTTFLVGGYKLLSSIDADEAILNKLHCVISLYGLTIPKGKITSQIDTLVNVNVVSDNSQYVLNGSTHITSLPQTVKVIPGLQGVPFIVIDDGCNSGFLTIDRTMATDQVLSIRCLGGSENRYVVNTDYGMYFNVYYNKKSNTIMFFDEITSNQSNISYVWSGIKNPSTGSTYFDTRNGKPLWYNGTRWVDANGNAVT